jgi:predicted house-cleaning noncanonical NTP pyrophosphatase (MazG superfamily)
MKLIRDKIPMIMQKANVNFEARIADNDEYKEFLIKKMNEEIEELMTDRNVEEAADVYEVFLSLIKVWGIELHDVVEAADAKREERGSFDERVLLIKSETYRPVTRGSQYSSQIFGKPSK